MNRDTPKAGARPRVLGTSAAGSACRAALERLIDRIAELGWLGSGRVALQLGGGSDDPVVSLTATRIVEVLLEANATACIDVIGARGRREFPARVRTLDFTTPEPFRLASSLRSRGILLAGWRTGHRRRATGCTS